MTEQALTTELSTLLPILEAAWMDAICDRWHLDNRATPPLRAMAGHAGDSRLLQAITHTTTAGERFTTAAAELRTAIALVRTCVPADDQDSQTA